MSFQVDVFTEDCKGLKKLPCSIRNRIRVFLSPSVSSFPSRPVYLRLIKEWINMRMLKDLANNYDLIFNVRAENLFDPIPLSHTKVIYHLYGPMITHWHAYKKYPKLLMRIYFSILDSIFLRRAKKAVVLANSRYTQKVLLRRGVMSEVVYPPCKIDDLYASQQKRDQVISVARISVEKKHEDAIRIAQHFPNVRFIILGEIKDGTYYRKLKKLKTPNVKIVTPSHDKFRKYLRRYLAESKIYIHLADDEPFGKTVVEAMASGCIPIVRNAGGPAEIVTKDVGFKWCSISEAVMQISNVLQNEKLQAELSSNALKRAHAFAPEVYQKKIVEILQKL